MSATETLSLDLPPELIERIAVRVAKTVRASMPSDDGWLDSEGAAASLAIPRSTLHKLTSAGTIPFSQDVPGGKLFFKRSALDAWREGR